MAVISAVYAQEILNSNGLPTVQCSLWLDTGHYVVSSAPSGTSKGKYEAKEITDGDQYRMAGQGVQKAVSNINQIIAPVLVGQDPANQQQLDQLLLDLDGTGDKSKLGANALIAVSQAIAKAGAVVSGLPLYSYFQQVYQLPGAGLIPNCIYTVINGGEHGADNLDIQEFEVIPASHVDFPTSLNMAVNIFQKLREVLIAKGAIHSVGMVGGFTPNLFNNTDAFEILIETIKASPYTFAQDVFFGADMAASSLFQNGKYTLKDKQQPYTSSELLDYYKTLRNVYHVFYLEDPFQEDDWSSWQKTTAEIGETTMVVGDTLLTGNLGKLEKAISEKTCNALLLKPNHLGTISEAIEIVKKAKEAGWSIVASHRSGETDDTFIADFAVGIGAQYAKFGPPNRGERVVKYNRLLQIYSELHASQAQTPAVAASTAEPPTTI